MVAVCSVSCVSIVFVGKLCFAPADVAGAFGTVGMETSEELNAVPGFALFYHQPVTLDLD